PSPREPGVLRKRVQHIGADSLLELRRTDRLIGSSTNPGIGRLTVAALFEAVDQFAKPTAQYAARTRTAEKPAQPSEHSARLPRTRRARSARCLLQPAEHLGDLVPVLVSGNSEKSQKRNHGRHSAAHFILL